MPVLNLIVSCPYDKTHRIRKRVLSYHLIRCRKNHLTTKVQCPFNILHVVDKECLEDHVSNCESSGNIQSALYTFGPQRELGTVPLETVNNISAPVMKDWEEEIVPIYDPWKNTEDRNIIRFIMCVSKSKKREFKLAERQRIHRLTKNHTCISNFKKKCETPRTYENISQVIADLRRLSLINIDSLLNAMSKLMLNETEQKIIYKDTKYVPDIVQQKLVEKFAKLVLDLST